MKIKRFFASSMRQAIRLVREEQGADAVILSNRRVDGGVEVIAATDYDEALIHQALGRPSADAAPPTAAEPERPEEPGRVAGEVPVEPGAIEVEVPAASEPATTRPEIVWTQDPAIVQMRQELSSMRSLLESQVSTLAWNDLQRRQPVRANVFRRLTGLGLDAALAREIDGEMPPVSSERQASSVSLALLARRIPVAETDVLDAGGVAAVVGPTGVGKTTTIAKLAARFALRHGRESVALVSTDGFRIGAQEQLATFARILDVPLYLADQESELRRVLGTLRNRRLVLIDTAGTSPGALGPSSRLSMLEAAQDEISVFLALAANCQNEALEEVAESYAGLQPHGAILTKLDEAASLGGALTTVIRHRLPITYITDGQRVPEDLRGAANKKLWLVTRAIEMLRRRPAAQDDEFLADNFAEVAVSALA